MHLKKKIIISLTFSHPVVCMSLLFLQFQHFHLVNVLGSEAYLGTECHFQLMNYIQSNIFFLRRI